MLIATAADRSETADGTVLFDYLQSRWFEGVVGKRRSSRFASPPLLDQAKVPRPTATRHKEFGTAQPRAGERERVLVRKREGARARAVAITGAQRGQCARA